MHRAGSSRFVPVGARCCVGTDDEEQSASDHAHAATAHGRPGHALAQVRSGRQDHSCHPQRGRRPPATGPQVPEGRSVRREAEWSSSLAVVAGPVESCGVADPRPSPWPRRGGRRCIRGGERSITRGPRFAWGRAQPCRAWAGAAIPCRYAEILRSNRSDCLEIYRHARTPRPRTGYPRTDLRRS